MSIVVDPAHAKLILYDGGRGGEFIAHLLNSHQECVSNLLSASESIAVDLVLDAVDRRHNDPED